MNDERFSADGASPAAREEVERHPSDLDNQAAVEHRPEDTLPPGWMLAPLGELGTWAGGGTPSKGVERYWNGSIPWVSPKDMKVRSITEAEDQITEEAINASATTLLPAGTVLMVTRSGILAHSFPIAVARVPVTINQDLKALIPSDGLDPGYIAWALSRFADDILGQCSKHGTTVHSIETPRLLRFRIPIAPRNEQRRIAEKIDELFSQIEAGEQVLARARKLLDRYRQSVLNAAVTGELTRDWRERHKGEVESGEALLQGILRARREAWEKAERERLRRRGLEPDDDHWKEGYKEAMSADPAGLPELPSGWVWVSFEALTDGHEANGLSIKGSDQPPGVPSLRLDAVQGGTIDYRAIRYIPLSAAQVDKYAVEKGDFLVSRANGSKPYVARASLVQERPFECIFPDTIIRFRPIQAEIAEWLGAIWPSQHVRDEIEPRAKTSTGIWKISQGDIRSVRIPLPSSVERRQIVNSLSQTMIDIERLTDELKQAESRTMRLRQSVLAAAFAGKLVPQNAADEPASVLLDRIRAERATAPPATKRRGRPAAARS